MTTVLDAASHSLSSTGHLPYDETVEMQNRLDKLYDAGDVKRLHTVPTVRDHTIAAHVYGSMLIATELVRQNRAHAAVSATSLSLERVLMALLLHDAPEVATGDIPAPVKRASASIADALTALEEEFYEGLKIFIPDLNPIERDIVKVSDSLDLVMNCVRERLAGNRHPAIKRVFERAIGYAEEMKHIVGVPELKVYLKELWRSV